MRNTSVIVVLLALAVFAGAMLATVVAEDSTPVLISTQTKAPTKTVTPSKIASPSKISRSSELAGLNSLLKNFAGKASGAPDTNAVKKAAALLIKDTQKEIASSSGKTAASITIPGFGAIKPQLDHLGRMPTLSTGSMPYLSAPGSDLFIALGI